MSLPLPLAVRLTTSRSSRMVTAEVRDLAFRWTDPGGYASCSVSLDRPLSVQPEEIAYYGQLTVYDGRNGATVWDGRLEDPGRSAGPDGQVWDLTAVGGQAHTRDRTVPLIYADRRSDQWKPVFSTTRYIRIGGKNDDAIEMKVDHGVTYGTSSAAVMYRAIADAGMTLGRVYVAWKAGFTDTNVRFRLVTSPDNATYSVLEDKAAGTADWYVAAATGASPAIPSGHDWAAVRMQRTAGSVVAGETTWGEFWDFRVRSLLKDRNGADRTSSGTYSVDTVLASEVVEDLLGRLLTEYDGPTATIATTTHAISQLAYPDGVTADTVLRDLMALEAGHTWRVWERTSDGLYRFEWTTTPSTVRYEADVIDGYDSQGSADGLYNSVTVRWRDNAGRVRTTIRTSSVPELTAAGLTRQGSIDLGAEVGSEADAIRAGDQWLAERQYAPNAGRLRIARPILDMQTGRMVQPWELRPGLIRVRGVLPRVDALNATARDGVTIFRIVSSEFRASDGAATLELDSHARTTPQILAELARRPVYRRT